MELYNGNKLTKTYIASLNYTQKHRLAVHILNFLNMYNFKQNTYSKSTLKKTFKYICNAKPVYKNQGNNIIISNQNNVGIKICRSFFGSLLDVRHGNKKSISDALSDKDILFKIILNRLGGMDSDNFEEFFNITPSAIITGAKSSFNAYRGSIFKPVTAKSIYDYWVSDGDRVLDYSAGFGGRMLGLKSTGKKCKYIGVEPNSATYKELLDLANYFNIDADLYCIGSEDFIAKDINFAFSSPPYFDYEIYSAENTQSIIRYNKYTDWLEKYWRATVVNIKNALAYNGVLAVNVGNTSNNAMNKYYNDMTKIIEEEGFCIIEQWFMETHTFSKKQKLEPINFYKIC